MNLRHEVTGKSFVYRINIVGARAEPCASPFGLDTPRTDVISYVNPETAISDAQ